MTLNSKHNNKKELRIKFQTPPALKRDLLLLAQERNITLSALLRLITTEYVKRNKTP